MKKRMLRLLCLMLSLCLLAPWALAEEGDESVAEEPVVIETLDYTDTIFVHGDTLYAQSWRSLLKKVDGGWLEYPLTDTVNIMNTTMAEDGLYYLTRQYEYYNEATDSWEKPDHMYAIGFMPLDASGEPGEPQTLCDLDWDVSDDDYPQIEGMQVQDGALYLLMHADEMDWDKLSLYRVDLTTGKAAKTLSEYISCLVGYKDGLLLARWYNYSEMYDDRGQLVRMPELVTLNPATGEIATLASMPAIYAGAIVYDAATDAVYCSDNTYVYRFDSDFAAAEPVGYLMGSSSSGRSYATGVIYRDHYLVTDWSDEARVISATIDPALLPTRTLRVTNAWYAEDAIRAFAKSHPDVAIEYVDVSGYTSEVLQSHMQSPQAADIYNLNLPYMPYQALQHYGLLSDLSSSTKLTELVSAMYPNMTQAYLMDGHLYGLPVYIYASMLGYYPDAFEKAGLTEEDVPTNYDELLDFMANWYYDYYDDYPEIGLFEWSPELRGAMFQLIFQQQVMTCQAKGEPLTFRTPEMQRLLNRLDSQEMKTVFDALGPKQSDGGTAIVGSFGEVYEEPTVLFSNYYSPMPQRYSQWNPPEPMMLRLNEDDDPAIEANIVLMVINRASQNQELAMELLEYISDNLPVDLRTALLPEVSDPIEVEYYQENVTYFNERIAECEKEIERLKASGKEDEDTLLTISNYEEQIVWYQEYLVEMEETERWAFTEEDIAYYQENVAPYLVISPSNIFGGENNPAANLIQMYVDGARDADYFVSEIDRIVSMMQQE